MERTSQPANRWRPALVCTLATVAVYAKTVSFPFVNWGDPVRMIDPGPGSPFDLASVIRSILNVHTVPYQPVTDFVFRLTAVIGHADPAFEHGVNVALQVLIGILLAGYLLRWGTGPFSSTVGALLFTLHPLRVESVAWVSGRSELLSTLFVLLSCLSFWQYRLDGRRRWYVGSLAAAVAGMASSVTAAPVGLVLITSDLLHHRPLTTRRWMEMAPFVLAGLGAIAVPAATWAASIVVTGFPHGWWVNAAATPSFTLLSYIWQTVGPSGLSVVYAVPPLDGWWWVILATLAVSLFFAWKATTDRPMHRFGLAWVLLFLLPASWGLTDAPSPISDRASVVAAIGLSIIVGALLQTLVYRDGSRFARPVKLSAALLIGVLGTLSSMHSEVWSSSVALWSAATERTPASALAHNYLGAALVQESNDLMRAELSFSLALHHDPEMSAAYVNRALTRATLGRTDEALRDLNDALRRDPDDADTRMVRASLLRRMGRRDEALRDMYLALAREPMQPAWMAERVELLLEMGRTGEAASELEVLQRAGFDVNIERRP